ncbi:DMT family transporter [Labrenzia aggregata]|uniref:DMT family transporter n=1 Tax=Roseibium aggregatum TaxID=187304 RepID=A0A939J685_9HYPH|nr:DMT family transporter [Roseibium aggregatum]
MIFAAAKFADGSVGAFQITFLRYVGALATVLLLAHWRGGLLAHRSCQPAAHFLRALCGSSAAVAITWASAHMPIADATAFGMLYGVIAVLLGVVFLKERLNHRLRWAIALSLAGTVIVIVGKGAFREALPAAPAFAAAASACLLAVEGLLIRILGQSEKALSVMLYVCFFGLFLMAAPAYANWQSLNVEAVFTCILLGPVSIGAQYATIRGYRSAPLSVVGPVDYTWIVFAALLGFVAFGERSETTTLVGGALIVLGGVLLVRTSSPPQ